MVFPKLEEDVFDLDVIFEDDNVAGFCKAALICGEDLVVDVFFI